MFFLLPLYLVSCTSKPSEKEVEAILNQNIGQSKTDKASFFSIGNVKKMNGVAGENGGIKNYQMQFSYDVIAKADVVNYSYKLFGLTVPKSEAKQKYISDSITMSKNPQAGKWSDFHQNVVFLKKGEKAKSDTGTIMLKKTENGWSTMGM